MDYEVTLQTNSNLSQNTLETYQPRSLKECFILVEKVACIINNIHRKGYLYLGIKPANVLVHDKSQFRSMLPYTEMFHSDYLISINDISGMSKSSLRNMHPSYTRGFAPLELMTLKMKNIGTHTDVYGIGALLFFLIFGEAPWAPDCETDHKYDFTKMKYGHDEFDGRLAGLLEQFFHYTLDVYYAERCRSAKDALILLRNMKPHIIQAVPQS